MVRDRPAANQPGRANQFWFSEIVSSPRKQKYSASHFGKSEVKACHLIPEEGALAIVTKRWDGMRWTRQRQAPSCAGRNAVRVRRSRVVLTPRCWRQVGSKCAAGDGDNKPAHRGEREVS